MITDEMVDAALREFKCWAGDGYSPSKQQIRAALEAAERVAWRPISEAPKDGTEILAYAQSDGVLERKFTGVAQWAEAADWNPNSVAGWFWPYAIRPTHFRALPTPPEAA